MKNGSRIAATTPEQISPETSMRDRSRNQIAIKNTGATTTINCSAWGCDERGYHIWRGQHLPHVAGVAPDGSSNNWWTYILSR